MIEAMSRWRALGTVIEVVVTDAESLDTTMAVVRRAIKERRGRGERTRKFVKAHGRYVAAEETAVIARVEGRAAKSRQTPRRPYRRVAWGRPTLLHNVETLARVAMTARGVDSGCSALATICGSAGELTVFGLPLGSRPDDAPAMVGVDTNPVRAVLVGGYFGT